MDAVMRALQDSRGAIRAEDTYDTDIDDLWEACTDPGRLAHWEELTPVYGAMQIT